MFMFKFSFCSAGAEHQACTSRCYRAAAPWCQAEHRSLCCRLSVQAGNGKLRV